MAPLAGGQAWAQTIPATTNTGLNLSATDFSMKLERRAGEGWALLKDFDLPIFFNAARCACKEEVRLLVELSPTGAAKKSQFSRSRGQLKVLIGPPECVAKTLAERNAAKCLEVTTASLVAFATQRTEAIFTVDAIFDPETRNCQSARGTRFIRLFVDETLDGIPELTEEAAPNLSLTFDSEPPPPPSDITIRGGNESLEVGWSVTTAIDDFRGYLVFCSRAENLVVFDPSPYDAQYESAKTRCPAETAPATGAAVTVDSQLAASIAQEVVTDQATGPFSAPGQFLDLDPRYLCSGLVTTQGNVRLATLQNGIPYLVGVASVDKSGNASPVESVFLQRPIPTRDFYRGYRAAGGADEGGYCAVARGSSRAPGRSGGRSRGVETLAALAGLTLALRRARRGRAQGRVAPTRISG